MLSCQLGSGWWQDAHGIIQTSALAICVWPHRPLDLTSFVMILMSMHELAY
jgi:hypothetical protein